MVFDAVFIAGLLLMAAGILLKPKRVGLGWALDVGYEDRPTRLERVLFFTGAALVLLALIALRGA
jgi:hypothetical protein